MLPHWGLEGGHQAAIGHLSCVCFYQMTEEERVEFYAEQEREQERKNAIQVRFNRKEYLKGKAQYS
jgi:hypothetical protein